jgi:hypothetical protein
MKKLTLASLATALSLLASPPARADGPTPSSVAPPISFCIGQTTHCVMPDFGISVVNYDLVAKKWSGGIQKISAGYQLLFYSDQPYGSGVAVHVSFDVSQQSSNYVSPSFMVVLMRYFEAGYTPTFMDGRVGHALTLGTNVPLDLLSGTTMADRLRAARPAGAPAGSQ